MAGQTVGHETVIGKTAKLFGKFTSENSVRVDGVLDSGDDEVISYSNILVGNGGSVVANLIKCNELIVSGSVVATIQANKVTLQKGSVVTGDIYSSNILMEIGSMLDGKTIMDGTLPATPLETIPVDAPKVTQLKG